ncbi:FkbH domain containing protein, partial [Trema orientale]
YVDNHKRKFAEQEFNAIKKRSKWQHGQNQKCTCIVTKKETKNVKRTVLKSVVGTLDLSIRYLLHGETFPGVERVKAPLFCTINRTSQSRYGYIANLCVAKSARRQGIASNMLHFAVESAISDGVEQVYVHVYRDNRAAQELYRKMGFEVVEMANSQLLEERTFLLCFKT